MRIENRRSKIETVVTKEEWKQMVDQQTSKLFKIIDKDDYVRGKINIPREIQEFKLARPERIVSHPTADFQPETTTTISKTKVQLAEEKADRNFNKDID